jgi:hypothetical protein
VSNYRQKQQLTIVHEMASLSNKIVDNTFGNLSDIESEESSDEAIESPNDCDIQAGANSARFVLITPSQKKKLVEERKGNSSIVTTPTRSRPLRQSNLSEKF